MKRTNPYWILCHQIRGKLGDQITWITLHVMALSITSQLTQTPNLTLNWPTVICCYDIWQMVIARTNWNQSCRQFYQHQVQKFLKAVFPLGKFSGIMPIWQWHTTGKFVFVTQGGKPRLTKHNIEMILSVLQHTRWPRQVQSHVAVTLATNVANVNEPYFLSCVSNGKV